MTSFRIDVARMARQAAVVALGMSALVGVAPAASAGAALPDTVVAPGWRAEMLASINRLRAAAGVQPLKPCPALRRSAQQYASLMAASDHFGHVGPDGSQPAERVGIEGYRWNAVAENIAAGQRSVAEAVAAWVASPDHNANLLDRRYRHVGLGHASSTGEYGDYWVQNFGRGRGC